MNDKIMEQRILEHNARNAEMVPVHIKEKRAYSVGDIMAMLDISRSSAYILIKKDANCKCKLDTRTVKIS